MADLSLLPHHRVRFRRAVVEGTEPLVEGNIVFSVIALEIAVMQLVKVGSGRDAGFTLYDEFLKTDMTSGHGGASGRFESLKDLALEYAFILSLEGQSE